MVFSTIGGGRVSPLSPLYPRKLFGEYPHPAVVNLGFPDDYLFYSDLDSRVRVKMFLVAWSLKADEVFPFLVDIRGKGVGLPLLYLAPYWRRGITDHPSLSDEIGYIEDSIYRREHDGTTNMFEGQANGELWLGHELLEPYLWPLDSLDFGKHVFMMLAYNYERDRLTVPRSLAYRRAYRKWLACGGYLTDPYRYFQYHTSDGRGTFRYEYMPSFTATRKRKRQDSEDVAEWRASPSPSIPTDSDDNLWSFLDEDVEF